MSALEALDALPLDEVTDEHIYAALGERVAEMTQLGGVAMDPHDFWLPEDFATYKQAAAWWPKDAPQSCSLPTLRELCMYVAGPAEVRLSRASIVLVLLANKASEWLVSEGRDPHRPNETPEERRRRLNKERVRRSRELARDAAVDPAGARVRELHAAYIAACKARKAAMQAAHDAHTPLVDSTRLEWEEAKRGLVHS